MWNHTGKLKWQRHRLKINELFSPAGLSSQVPWVRAFELTRAKTKISPFFPLSTRTLWFRVLHRSFACVRISFRQRQWAGLRNSPFLSPELSTAIQGVLWNVCRIWIYVRISIVDRQMIMLKVADQGRFLLLSSFYHESLRSLIVKELQ